MSCVLEEGDICCCGRLVSPFDISQVEAERRDCLREQAFNTCEMDVLGISVKIWATLAEVLNGVSTLDELDDQAGGELQEAPG